jgi:hypothetical protein
VRVHLWGELGFYGPGKQSRFEFPISDEMPVSVALRLIGVPEADIAVFGLNGVVVRLGDPSVTVADQDRIDCFPGTSGG